MATQTLAARLGWTAGKTLVKLLTGYILLMAFIAVPVTLATVIHFPYHTDRVAPPVNRAANAFYSQIYSTPSGNAADTNGAAYLETAQEVNRHANVVPKVAAFARQFGLRDKRVLDVGAGTGYLQDVVSNYVGLDISPTARRFFHKPYVEASATEMPFRDGEFDGLWSIWVLEHVPNPEQALTEMRRVVKDGGVLFLLPAWNCTSWAGEGYPVRPYSDFGPGGKLIKASVVVRSQPLYRTMYLFSTRFLREGYAWSSNKPTHLHYSQVKPNFDHYWMPDSDAINSIDSFEAMLWFTSRGDECLSCGPHPILENQELVIRVHKN